ncbi:Calcineurin-like phosphoesterase, partial [Globisporangium splendens]
MMTTRRLHDGYTLVGDADDSPQTDLRHRRRPAPTRLREKVILMALVVALGVGFTSFLFEPRRGIRTRHSHMTPFVMGNDSSTKSDAVGSSDEKPYALPVHQDPSWDEVAALKLSSGFELSTWPKLVEDGGDLVVFWQPGKHDAVQDEDYITLSCGPTLGDDDYLVKKSIKELDATPNSVRFSGNVPKAGNYKLLQQLEVGMLDSLNAPKHGHLALTTKDDEMVVMFNSASSRTPQARYGLSASELTNYAEGTSTTYKASDMCHAPATTTAQRLFRDPGFMHKVVLTKLKPGEYYFYQYGNDEDGWSKVRSFRSKPAATTKTTNFVAYADMGVDGSPAAQSTAVRVYARGEGSVWDKFFHVIEPYATRTPYMISVGNHEYVYTSGGDNDPSGGAEPSKNSFHPSWGNYGSDSNGECSVPMYRRFHAPATGNSIYWYSFNYGGVHVVQISTEHNWTRGSEQYEWLKKDLESVDRGATPWVVLTAHRMMYSTQLGMESDMIVAKHFRDEVEELIYKNRVNLMLVGHQHAYERSCPVYRGECVGDEKAPVHIVVGSAGFDLGTEDFSTKYGNWSVRHANEYGHLRVSTSADAMNLQFVLNKNGAVYDEFAIKPWVLGEPLLLLGASLGMAMATADSLPLTREVALAPVIGRPASSPSLPFTPSDLIIATSDKKEHTISSKPRLTTPEKKERDKRRKREQAKRHVQILQDRDNAA